MKEKIVFQLKDEFIKLGQLLKAAGCTDDGVQAKYVVQEGLVKVNGEIETRRGKKLREGDIVTFQDMEVTISRSEHHVY